MEFSKRKTATLTSIASTEIDKSPKGTIDVPIIPLLNAINLHSSYFTTSSCSGRISILSQPSTATTTGGGDGNRTAVNKKARGGSWLYISHEPADPDSIITLLFPSPDSTPLPAQPHDLVLRFEPLIIAVECRDVVSAQSLVSLAIASGFRESGITNTNKRVIIAIRCSIRMEVPLGDTSKIRVSPEYVRYLVELANAKMEANRKRTDGFFQALLCNGFGKEIVESGDEVPFNAGKEMHDETICSEGDDCSNVEIVDANSENTGDGSHNGLSGVSGCRLSIIRPIIVGEPVEKLFLWSHSACTLPKDNKVVIFGGFGGMGRHSRRNECLIFEPINGNLSALDVENAPSPRLGHTSSLIGDSMYVIGGRADPVNILSDVWLFNTSNNKWRLLECTGSVFPPRHRHASAAVGSRIYVFGGLNNDILSSSLHVLDTDTSQWSEICIHGDWPSARHSHTLVAYASHLYMFGGYDGDTALNDFYSFDVDTCLWKKEKTSGRMPYARFSHSMFVYQNLIGIIGGCPVKQHHHELALLDMQCLSWKHVILNSGTKDLLVRSTANIVGDHLVLIGGGAACYAFGTTFSEPILIDMLSLLSLQCFLKPSEGIRKNVSRDIRSDCLQKKQNGTTRHSAIVHELDSERAVVDSLWVLQLEKKYAKLLKDLLKKFGWLDLKRKVYTAIDQIHICFPVTNKFRAIFHDAQHLIGDTPERMSDSCTNGLSLNDVSCSTSLDILKGCGATLVADEVVEFKKATNSPLKMMNEAVAPLIESRGLSGQLLEQLPSRWERIGDLVVLPSTSFKDPIWDSFGEELWLTIAKSLRTTRLARQGRVAPTGTRDSTLEILVGDNGWVEHRENGIIYSFDTTKCMFSWGNLSEKLRMASLDCRDEVIVDLFSGIGYFTLPFLVRANAKFVYACEWNPHAVEALRHNVQANSVTSRCTILEGDNRIVAPEGVADRVCLGLIPTSEGSWATAVKALRNKGGTLHIHGNVKDSEEDSWTEHVSKSIHEIATAEGRCWEVSVVHVQRVKWYAPHIRHLVADVKCRQMER